MLSLILASCARIPIGSESETSYEASTIVITTPSDDASYAVSEQSDIEEPTSEPVSEDVSEPEETFEYDIDITPYLQYICPENEEEYLLLVNYDSRLTGEYVPSDLVVTTWTRGDRDGQKLRKTCAMALDALMKEAEKNGVTDVTVTSAYRSYTYQKWLFGYYVDQYIGRFSSREECEKYVMTFSCREGCSEHQTGLAFDMHNLPAADVKFANTPEYAWLAANAHRFGFILRFPEDKEDVTGISFEPWHYRFVGRKAATYIYRNGMCLEEYCALFMN